MTLLARMSANANLRQANVLQSAVGALIALAGAGCAHLGDAPAQVPALRETPAVGVAGDAADDPAIWVASPASDSLVVTTQKQGGLIVYGLDAKIVQELRGGRPNNVDLRDGFTWPQGVGPIVGAGDRSDNALVLWRLDSAARRLDPAPAARVPTGFTEVYGFCLGRMGQDFIAVATDKDIGGVGVWKIGFANGGLTATKVMSFVLGSIAEGCVVDDEHGVLFVSEELKGLWRIPLGSADGAGRTLIDHVGKGGHLAADVEGVSLWAKDGAGYLVVSAQGQSRYNVYDRLAPHAYRGTFRIGASADGKADGVSGTDGIDVTSASLGPEFPSGLMVAQDDENTNPAETQDFKYVSWEAVAAALGL